MYPRLPKALLLLGCTVSLEYASTYRLLAFLTRALSALTGFCFELIYCVSGSFLELLLLCSGSFEGLTGLMPAFARVGDRAFSGEQVCLNTSFSMISVDAASSC
jgi:hypothetical protein